MSHQNQPLSAGVPVRAIDFPRAHFNYNQTTQSNITDTSYVTGSPETGIRFRAPSSGRVCVVLGAIVENNAANADRVFVAYRILEGDPDDNDLFQTEEVKFGISNAATGTDEFHYGGHATMVGGLEPGTYYYAQVRHRTTLGSGTADVGYRHLLIFPIP